MAMEFRAASCGITREPAFLNLSLQG